MTGNQDEEDAGKIGAMQLLLSGLSPHKKRYLINSAFPDEFAISLQHAAESKGGLKDHLIHAIELVEDIEDRNDGASPIGLDGQRTIKAQARNIRRALSLVGEFFGIRK